MREQMNAYEFYEELTVYMTDDQLLNEVWNYFGEWKMEEAFRSIANDYDIPLDGEDEQ